MKKLIALLTIVSITACNNAPTTKQPIDSPAVHPHDAGAETTPASVWTYSNDVDKMTNEKKFFAEVKSTNKIDFDFPYEGGSSFFITLRNADKKNEVILTVSKGQFITHYGDEGGIKAKFDDGKPELYSVSPPSDGDSKTLFIGSEKKFIAKLKEAKKVMIEAEFFQAGNKVIEFDVSGLEWKY